MKVRPFLAVLCLTLLTIRPATSADLATGKSIVMHGNGHGAPACAVCHGLHGAGKLAGHWPRLAGQHAAYLQKELHDFADQFRDSPVMHPIALSLSDREISDVSAYYQAQHAPATQTAQDDPALIAAGRRLVTRGDWDRLIPACIQCHGPGARGIAPHFPALAGQDAAYIQTQIRSWKDGERRNDPNQLMRTIALRLSTHQVRAAAAYLSSLEPMGE
ncbi:MAG: c-type cytochrome [Gammaproteobacteria bacterium]